MDSLYKVEAITAQQHDVAKSDLDSAQAAYNSAIQNNKLVDEGARIEDKHAADDAVKQAEAALKQAQAALDQAKAGAIQGSVKRAEMAQAQAMISKAKAARAIALVNRSYAAVNAPFDGVVSDRLADPGAMAGPGVPLLKVEGGLLQIDASVPESLVSHLAVGTNVSVSTDALQSKSIPARVLSISPQGDPGSHTFLVKANLPSGAPIKSGMYARMRIKTGESRAIMVPFDAVVDREGLNYVYVASNGVAQLRLVTVGGTENGLCSLLSGVQSGEKVIISNMARISDNLPISEAK
jgi:RND family efflux transporter MFP subunit